MIEDILRYFLRRLL